MKGFLRKQETLELFNFWQSPCLASVLEQNRLITHRGMSVIHSFVCEAKVIQNPNDIKSPSDDQKCIWQSTTGSPNDTANGLTN